MRAEAQRFYSLVSKTPGVCGGKACIHDTRIRVMDIVGLHRAGYTPEQMLEQYPSLTLAQVYAALSYYYEHPDEIEVSIQEDSEWENWSERRKAEYLARKSKATR